MGASCIIRVALKVELQTANDLLDIILPVRISDCPKFEFSATERDQILQCGILGELADDTPFPEALLICSISQNISPRGFGVLVWKR